MYPHGLWPSTNSFPISLSGIIPTSSQSLGPLNTNKNSPLWDLIFSKSDIKPHHAIQNFPHFGLDNKVQMNRIAQNLTRSHGDDGRECSSENAKRSCNNESSTSDTIFKRPRLDTTNCPMPTFKVRKEKLGDRITALQQLVSPFGKTDTASVLLEAIGYIKFLHDQVQVLSTPYMNNGAANSGQGGEAGWAGGSSCEGNDSDGGKQDLRSRGLCLVPVSATLSVTNDNGADYWSPALGCNYR